MPVKRIDSEWTVSNVALIGGTVRWYAFRNVIHLANSRQENFHEYLHADIVARESTVHEGKCSGYFYPESDALAAIELYNKQVNTESDQ